MFQLVDVYILVDTTHTINAVSIIYLEKLICYLDMGFRDEIKINHIGVLIQTILPIPFCFLTLFILVYYIRRRYKLYNEKRNISQELLQKESYQNYLKNLKIMGIINNFLIVILVLELVQNVSFSIRRLPRLAEFFDEGNAK